MINLLFVGDSQVGKSSLVERFCRNSFSESYTETKSVESIRKTIEYNDSTLELQLFDANGRTENRKVLKEYYEKVSGVLLVFSLTDRASFNSVKKWMETLQKNLSSTIPIVLVGNKQDVGEKIVAPEDINQIIEEYKLKYFEVSAKENIRVSELFTSLVAQTKSGQSGKGTPRHQLSRQNSSGTPRKLILQSLQSFGDVSQTVLTQKIQEQMAMFKVELLESMEDQRKKELENMEVKIQTLEKQLQLSQETIAKEIELKTSSYLNELKEENKNLLLKLEKNLGVKTVDLVEQGNNLEECHDKNSVYYHDSSVHESEGRFPHAEFAKQFEDEIHEIKRRLNETDIRLMQTLRQIDTKHLELMKEVNLRAGGTLTDAELLAIGERFIEVPQSSEDLAPPVLKPRTSAQKNKIGRVKAYSNFALSVNTHGKTGSVSHRRKFSALDGAENNQDYVNSETIIRGESQVSPAVTQPHPTSIFIYNEDNNYGQQHHDADHYNHSNLHLGNESEVKIDDGHHEIHSGFRVQEGFRNIEEEITLIWKTINTIIENAQDQISRLRTEYSPTTNQAQRGDDQEPVSLSELKNDETPVDLLKKDFIEEPKTPMKNAQPEKDLKVTLIELKDDVHNQILGVQREFEKELLGLKDILMGHYKNFSGKMEQENFALKDYIDGKIEELSIDIDKMLTNYEPEVVRSARSMSEGKIRSSTQSKEAVFDIEVAGPANNTNNNSIIDLKDYVTETKLKEVQDMQEELGKSMWETISLMANRLAQVEQDVVTKITQHVQKKV